MTRLAALLLIAISIVTTAEAQTERTFVYDFGDRTVYLEVAEHWLEVWSVTSQGCMMYPSTPEMTGATITFRAGTTWEVVPSENGVTIAFPNGEAITYRTTEKEPEQICGLHHKET